MLTQHAIDQAHADLQTLRVKVAQATRRAQYLKSLGGLSPFVFYVRAFSAAAARRRAR